MSRDGILVLAETATYKLLNASREVSSGSRALSYGYLGTSESLKCTSINQEVAVVSVSVNSNRSKSKLFKLH
jgi:hypothetical protein